jgi:hypothetical protein
MTLTPDLGVGARYDSLLQSALRQFFDRAAMDAEHTASTLPDSRLAIEPSANPAALIIRWFGTRYTLRVPGRWAFSAHEVRLAQVIGAVLAARYHAILNPRIIAERGDLFRGVIEDRYVGAFLDHKAYTIETREARADRIASVIELLRVAALSSYENRPISSGVLLLDGERDGEHVIQPTAPELQYKYSPALTGIKSFFRICDGLQTLFLVNNVGTVLDIVEVARYAKPGELEVPNPSQYKAHALATANNLTICVVLSPSHEIKIFAGGVQVFSFRNARWHLLDIQAKYDMWETSVGNRALAERLFQTALDLADAREGALFVVLKDPQRDLGQLVAPADRLDFIRPPMGETLNRPQLLHMLNGRTAVGIDPAVLASLAKTDGATVMDNAGRLLAVGAILLHSEPPEPHSSLAVEGARTTAAMAAGRFGSVLKVSEDGLVTFYDNSERIWDI